MSALLAAFLRTAFRLFLKAILRASMPSFCSAICMSMSASALLDHQIDALHPTSIWFSFWRIANRPACPAFRADASALGHHLLFFRRRRFSCCAACAAFCLNFSTIDAGSGDTAEISSATSGVTSSLTIGGICRRICHVRSFSVRRSRAVVVR